MSISTSSYGTNPENIFTSSSFISCTLYDIDPSVISTFLPQERFIIQFRKVVLPAPEGPMIAKNSPGRMPPVTLERMTLSPNLDFATTCTPFQVI